MTLRLISTSFHAPTPQRRNAFVPVVVAENSLPTDSGAEGMDDKPPLVSREVWDTVPLEDRQAVRRRAARLYCVGRWPDDAIREAQAELRRQRILEGDGRGSNFARAMVAAVPEAARTGALIDNLIAGATAAISTAEHRWRDILVANDPLRAGWPVRDWHAPKGRCLLTSAPVTPATAIWGRDGDFVHRDAADYYQAVVRLFCEAVLAECQRLRDETA